MSDPYYHSLSTCKRHGGQWEDWWAYHYWFDVTKTHWSDPRHRALRHHTAAIEWITQKYAAANPNTDWHAIGHQHLQEDLGNHAQASTWWEQCNYETWMRGSSQQPKGQTPLATAYIHAEQSANRFGGAAENYLPIHLWMDGIDPTTKKANDPNWDPTAFWARGILHHSAGIELAIDLFGPVLQLPKRNVPLRYILETHIRLDMGIIPPPINWLKALPLKSRAQGAIEQLEKQFETNAQTYV